MIPICLMVIPYMVESLLSTIATLILFSTYS